MLTIESELICILSLYHGKDGHEYIMTMGNGEIIATSVKDNLMD